MAKITTWTVEHNGQSTHLCTEREVTEYCDELERMGVEFQVWAEHLFYNPACVEKLQAE
jgi:hypothetical protein